MVLTGWVKQPIRDDETVIHGVSAQPARDTLMAEGYSLLPEAQKRRHRQQGL
jgi:hypothetical protein